MSRYDLSRTDLAVLLDPAPRYRVDQLYDGLYRRFAELDEIVELPLELRRRLQDEEAFRPALRVVTESVADRGQTVKWLFALPDDQRVETVLMHYPRHSTVCISSQAGCAMGCTFCATGDAGYSRQLSTGEIVEQVVRAARSARTSGRRLDHVVFMGMGEPFANFARVWPATERIVGEIGLGARHVTLSTVGLVPQIRMLAAKPLQVNLAVSLHAANDELRDSLVPINRRYPIAALCDAIADYIAATHRRVSFEWALIADVNDRDADAHELAGLAASLGAHVNLIPLNPTSGGLSRGLVGSRRVRVLEFQSLLRSLGTNVTVRRTRGLAIDAACGQLAGSVAQAEMSSIPLHLSATTSRTR